MSTSGTIGVTTVKTAKLIEKAVRRCGLAPSGLTPEMLETALEDLFMLLLSLSNRGINLWCVDKKIVSLIVAKAGYDLPVGTIDLLNVLHALPTRVTGTDTSDASSFTTQLDSATQVRRVGIKPTSVTGTLYIEYSDDGVSWTTAQTIAETLVTGVYNWFDLDPMVTATYFRVRATALALDAFYLACNVREITVTAFNRDDYSAQPNKGQQSQVATNYYFEKLVNPRITLWPVPNDDTCHLVVFRHRQVQDIGTLTQELELPSRWLEAITWQLALRLAFELPGVDAQRRDSVAQMASTMLIEGEGNETDNAPIYLAPNIRVYTR